ncbi:MAG: tetratricopeptide repeat protein [Saprospiraceae bacterium]
MADRLQRILDMLTSTPTDAFLLFALAQEHKNADRPDEAIAAFKNLRDLHPDYVGLYYHYAAVLAESERNTDAEEAYKAGIEVAQKAGDQHALAELKNAFLNWQIEQD